MKLTWDKLLQGQGFGSRKGCQQLLAAGRLSVGGIPTRDPRHAVETDGLVFAVDGIEWTWRARLYLALNKPVNIECSRKPSHHPGVLSLLPDEFRARDVQPVGRIDEVKAIVQRRFESVTTSTDDGCAISCVSAFGSPAKSCAQFPEKHWLMTTVRSPTPGCCADPSTTCGRWAPTWRRHRSARPACAG